MSHFEIEPKLFHVRIYGEDADKYVSSFQAYVDGDKAFLYSLNGPGFYENARELIRGMMDKTGVRTVEAHVMPSHARLLEIALKGFARVEVGSPVRKTFGRTFCWIRISDPAVRAARGEEPLRPEPSELIQGYYDDPQEDHSVDWGEHPPLETLPDPARTD